MKAPPIIQSPTDTRDKFLTIGFHPDKRVRKGDIVKIIKGNKYDKGGLYVVDYAINQPNYDKNGAICGYTLIIRCRGGELIPADNCIICAMAKERYPRHYHKVKKKVHKRTI